MHPFRRRTARFACCLLVPLTFACARDADDTDPPPPADVPAAAPAPAPAPAQGARAEMPPGLQNRVNAYTAAWNGSDPAAVAAFFTDDATVRVGDDSFSGRQQIQNGWLQNVPNINDLQINETSSEQRGQDYYAEGTYTHAPVQTGPTAGATRGRFNVTWTRAADGQWRIRSTEVMPETPATT
jgi:uncharacterized protein (TIGR02246 family)